MFNNRYQEIEYPVDALPYIVKETVNEVANHIKVRVPMSAVSAVMTMTVAIQGLIRVKLPTGQIKPVSQNVAFLGESGDRKSAVDEIFSASIKRDDERKMHEYSEELEDYFSLLNVWDAKATGLRRAITKAVQQESSTDALCMELQQHEKGKPRKPRLRRTVRTDISERALLEALEGEGESIVAASDEGQLILKNVAFSQSSMPNKAWDGGTLVYDRSGESIIARNPAMSVSFMVQPEVFREFVEKHGKFMRGSGAWARYLFAWPSSMKGFRCMAYNDFVWKHLPNFHARVNELLAERNCRVDSGNVEFDIIEFAEEAKYRYIDEVNYIEDMLRPCGYLNDISDFASKAMEIAGRLAAVMHRFTKQEGKITVDTLERAIAIMVWHLEEFKRIFSLQENIPQVQIDMQAIVNYLHRTVWSMEYQFVARNQVFRCGPVRNLARFNAALDSMALAGRIWIGIDQKTKRRYINLNQQFFQAMSHEMAT